MKKSLLIFLIFSSFMVGKETISKGIYCVENTPKTSYSSVIYYCMTFEDNNFVYTNIEYEFLKRVDTVNFGSKYEIINSTMYFDFDGENKRSKIKYNKKNELTEITNDRGDRIKMKKMPSSFIGY